jgi:inner membrane protein
MPSLGHVAVGLAAGRWRAGDDLRVGPAAAFVLLATFPDVDVWAGRLAAGSPWLHRGATHSLPVAAAVGLAVALLLEGRRLRASTLVLAVGTAASHGLLDTVTHGGSGVMLLWPFSPRRWLAPWAPLPAAPMGTRLLSPRGVVVMGTELLLCAPLLAYALWPRTRRRRLATAGDASPPT